MSGIAPADDLVARLTLLSLPGIGPARARWLLDRAHPADVLAQLRAGRLPADLASPPPGVTSRLVQTWCATARRLDGADLAAAARDAGVGLLGPADDRWPFTHDPEPPALAFYLGELDLLARRPAVAVVGTRRCTAIGREVAHRLGTGLAEAGVAVISGLATGIDGAAHRGTLAAGGHAIAVAGTGLDVVYPRANAALWQRVARDGLLLSEAPPGARPERWRFPARNRLIASLADLVVVVESHQVGGSLLTVEEATERGVTVMAVPGAVTSPASAGANQLLAEGCAPARSALDVLDALRADGLDVALPSPAPVDPSSPTADASAADDLPPLHRQILGDTSASAVHVDQLVASCRVPVAELLAALRHLETAGLVLLDGSTVVRAEPPAMRDHPPGLTP